MMMTTDGASVRVVNPRRRIGRTVWTDEMKLAVQVVQGNRCSICGASGPDRFDVIYSETNGGLPRVTLVGALCRTCKGGLDLFRHDTDRLQAAITYLAAPPANDAFRLLAEGLLSVASTEP